MIPIQFRIDEYENGFGEKVYVILEKYKYWPFWFKLKRYIWVDETEVIEFKSKEVAEKYLDGYMRSIDNNHKTGLRRLVRRDVV